MGVDYMVNMTNKYNNELKVSKIDGILAIFMICYVFFSTAIGRYIVFDLGLWDKFASYFDNRLFAKFLFQIFPVFIILKYRKQNLKSIGFDKTKILKQIIIGVILYIPLYLILLILT